MKKIVWLLFIVAINIIAACENNEEESYNHISTSMDIHLEKVPKIEASLFKKYAIGQGWKETEAYVMNEDGTIQTTSWGDINGWAPSVFEFYDSGTATEYVGLPRYNVNWAHKWDYDEKSNILLIDGEERFKLISISETEIQVAETGIRNNKKSYVLFEVFHRMDDEQLRQTKIKYFINYEDINREMTHDDIIHKWVLMNYTVNSKNVFIGDDRADTMNYIRFEQDGSFNGMANGKAFAGKYEYNGDKIRLRKTSPDDTSDNFFLSNIWSVTDVKIDAAARISLYNTENGYYFNFLRAIE